MTSILTTMFLFWATLTIITLLIILFLRNSLNCPRSFAVQVKFCF